MDPRRDPLASLSACVASAQQCCQTLDSAISVLSAGVNDFPRLRTVLASQRVFELVTESELRTARDHVAGEIEPQLENLISRAEEALVKDERKVKELRNKATLQSNRLAQLRKLAPVASIGSSSQSAKVKKASVAEQRKLKALQVKRERLQRSVAALEAEVARREA